MAYILAKVFSRPLQEIRSFNDRRTVIIISARALVMRYVPVLRTELHIKPSVEFYPKFISVKALRSLLKNMRKRAPHFCCCFCSEESATQLSYYETN